MYGPIQLEPAQIFLRAKGSGNNFSIVFGILKLVILSEPSFEWHYYVTFVFLREFGELIVLHVMQFGVVLFKCIIS